MRIVMKTKKYQNPQHVTEQQADSKSEATSKKMLTADEIMREYPHFAADQELVDAMKEASQVKYDICTIAAMQHYIESQK